FREHVEIIGPLKPPLLVLVAKDDAALRASAILGGGIPRGGALDVNDPVVREAALKARVQVVDISQLVSSDPLNHNRFVSMAALYLQVEHKAERYKNTPGTFVFNKDSPTMVDPVDIGPQVAAR